MNSLSKSNGSWLVRGQALWNYYFNNPRLGAPTDTASELEQCKVRVLLGLLAFALGLGFGSDRNDAKLLLFALFSVNSVVLWISSVRLN